MRRNCACCIQKRLHREEEGRAREFHKNNPEFSYPNLRVGRPSGDLRASYLPPVHLDPFRSTRSDSLRRASPRSWSSIHHPQESRHSSIPRPQSSFAPVRRHVRTHSGASPSNPDRSYSQSSVRTQPVPSFQTDRFYLRPRAKKLTIPFDLKAILRYHNHFAFDPMSDLPLAYYHVPLPRGSRQGRPKGSFVPLSPEVRKRIAEGASTIPSRIPPCPIRRRSSYDLTILPWGFWNQSPVVPTVSFAQQFSSPVSAKPHQP